MAFFDSVLDWVPVEGRLAQFSLLPVHGADLAMKQGRLFSLASC